MNNQSPSINVTNVVFEYPGTRALENVSFNVPRGSITALVGPNGAGKTTLLRCIAGLEAPLSGQIQVDGIDVLNEPRICHQRMGYLADNFGLYKNLTVEQCLYYAAAAHNVTYNDIKTAVLDTANKLQLTERLAQKTSELSRGLKQRVAIGQAIIHHPKVILLDEPASGLDPEARHELSGLFRLLRNQGMTLLVSSHILTELAEYSTDMLILKAGQIIDQRTITSDTSSEIALELTLVEPLENIVEYLSSQPNVTEPQVQGAKVQFNFVGDHSARYQLLKTLLDAGIAVCGLTEAHQKMETSYLESVGKTTPNRRNTF